MPARPLIAVVGSLNVDHVLRVRRLPTPGETLTARSALTCFGGKGANQALAAARAGGEVTLIGCVGEDDNGGRYLEHLRREGICIEAIARSREPTGSAFIVVDDAGENSIVVHPGANHALRPEHLDLHVGIIRAAAVVLLQLECPMPSVLRAVALASESGVPVMLNPSPLTREFVRAGLEVDTLIVNELEAAELGLDLRNGDTSRLLAKARCRRLIVTRGGDPTMGFTAEGKLSMAPPQVVPVDTVGAGDTFAGALAVALAEGLPWKEAIRFANAAGALATQKPGAQESIPSREAIEALLRGGGAQS